MNLPQDFFGRIIFIIQNYGISLLKGQEFKLNASAPQVFQTDGEVLTGVNEFSIKITD